MYIQITIILIEIANTYECFVRFIERLRSQVCSISMDYYRSPHRKISVAKERIHIRCVVEHSLIRAIK